jgi:hypothetical protein
MENEAQQATPEHKHLIPQSREEWVDLAKEKAIDKVKDTAKDHLVYEPLKEGARRAGEFFAEKAPTWAATQGGVVGDAAAGLGKALPEFADAIQVGQKASALFDAAATDAAIVAVGSYGVYKGTTWVDEHTNHSITNSAPAQKMGELQERSGADERVWYAQQAKDSFDAKHPNASFKESGLVFAKALVDPHMKENHVLSLQDQVNRTLLIQDKAHALISTGEARMIYDALQHAQNGDKVLIDKHGNVELVSGTLNQPPEKGTTTFDAQTLRSAATMRYEPAEAAATHTATEKVAQQPNAPSHGQTHER